MRFVSIASGSSGNCIYTGTEESHILIDAGISAKRIEQGLNEVGLKTSELDGICITHEHSDHVKGLGVLARKYEVPIYATEGTLNEIKKIKGLGEYPEELLHPILPDTEFALGGSDSQAISHRPRCRRPGGIPDPVGKQVRCGSDGPRPF